MFVLKIDKNNKEECDDSLFEIFPYWKLWMRLYRNNFSLI